MCGVSEANTRFSAGDGGTDGGVVVLRLTGEIDMSNSDELRDRAVEALDTASGALVLDLSGVTFFASSGLAALAQLRRHGAESGRRVHVVASRNVRRTLELTSMSTLLPLHDGVEDAVRAASRDEESA
ncbi:anti-anti-sigma factor [Saccharothrix yanglingensis]|uniref:Anti-sigma factor antagonist n=1 Tax=Saccharothrix yanglingensis TaxID=659496 RepID=A0ABU0WYW2_9PSEU|nr:anti-anti-sigma factor [Saccharothrix yanglingensis]